MNPTKARMKALGKRKVNSSYEQLTARAGGKPWGTLPVMARG